ncbi:hypothetical protein WBJ53_04745 [Spirosoma sp. SC4-14]|uniref:hypothetical protein n=1 Tax=Spirosoma sp. SC4-14 TaxID=3128900 RepID=UPI0030D2F93D
MELLLSMLVLLVGFSLIAIIRLERQFKRFRSEQKARDERYQQEIDYLNENIDQLYQALKERATLFRIHEN